jgi:hypothetical protein
MLSHSSLENFKILLFYDSHSTAVARVKMSNNYF